jgi:hypothetical protein
VGFLLAATVLLLELTTGFLIGWQRVTRHAPPDTTVFSVAAVIAYLSGFIYWFRWVYRIHKVLAEASESKYPISPRKAVGYQFIPFYSLYWNFKWPNRIAAFVRENSGNAVRMSKGWIGLWLLFASFLGLIDKGLELVLLFSISAYLARKIRRAIAVHHWAPTSLTTFAGAPQAADALTYGGASLEGSAPVEGVRQEVRPVSAAASSPAARPVEAWNLSMSREWRLPVNAGIGAAFGFLMCYGLWFLLSAIEQKGNMMKGLATEGVNILLVAIVLYFFLEPLADKVLQTFHVLEEHHAAKKLWQRIFKFGVFVVIVDVAHSLLEKAAEEGGGFKVASLGILLTLFFGGMTYLWISGARKRLRDALVLVGPGTVLLLLFGVVVVANARQMEDKFSETSISSIGADLGQRLQNLKDLKGLDPGAPGAEEFAREIANSQNSKKDGIDGALVLACAVFVALAGFAAMRMKLGPTGVAGSVFVASLLSAATLSLIPYCTLERFYIVITLWSAFWWCLGMLAFYDHDIFHPSAVLSLSSHSEGGTNSVRFPRLVWLVSSLFLAGLIVAAYYFRPQGREIAAPTLSVIADDKERPYGAANPMLTSRVTGLEHGDTQESVLRAEPSLCSAAVPASPPGIYPIAVGLGSGEMNEEKYRFRFIPGNLKVVAALTQVSLASSAATATTTSPVTFTAAIAPQSGGSPSGTVTFYADANPLGTEALSSGTASYTARGLPLGAHLITAKYSGDTNFSSAMSAQWTQQITPPPVPRPEVPIVPAMTVIPAGTSIYVAVVHPIDSSTGKPSQPLVAMLAAPLVIDGHVFAQKGSVVILGVSDIDSDGRLNGKPVLTIHLMRLEIAGKNYKPDSALRMQGRVPGLAGRIRIPAATILTFRLQSPITTDVPTATLAASRPPRR